MLDTKHSVTVSCYYRVTAMNTTHPESSSFSFTDSEI